MIQYDTAAFDSDHCTACCYCITVYRYNSNNKLGREYGTVRTVTPLLTVAAETAYSKEAIQCNCYSILYCNTVCQSKYSPISFSFPPSQITYTSIWIVHLTSHARNVISTEIFPFEANHTKAWEASIITLYDKPQNTNISLGKTQEGDDTKWAPMHLYFPDNTAPPHAWFFFLRRKMAFYRTVPAKEKWQKVLSLPISDCSTTNLLPLQRIVVIVHNFEYLLYHITSTTWGLRLAPSESLHHASCSLDDGKNYGGSHTRAHERTKINTQSGSWTMIQ